MRHPIDALRLVVANLARLLRPPGRRARERGEGTRAERPPGLAPSALQGATDADAVAKALLEHVERLPGIDLAAFALVDESAGRVRGVSARLHGRELEPYRGLEYDLRGEPSALATAAFERVPFALVETYGSSRPAGALVAGVKMKSAAYVPLVARERALAVLVAGRTEEPRAFTSDELAGLQAVAAEAAVALEQARLTADLSEALDDERRRTVQQQALLRAAQALTSDLELDAVLQRLVEHLADLLEADAADCYLLDEDRRVLRCAALHGLPQELLGFEFPAGRGLAGRALAAGGPVVSDAYEALDAPVAHEAYDGFGSALVAPLRWGDRSLGVLGVGVREGRRFGPDDVELLQAYAGLASLALANAQAFDARARQARVEGGFFRIATVLGRSLSLDETLESVAHAAAEALGGDSAAVLMPGGSTLEVAASADLPAALSEVLSAGLPGSAAVLGAVAEDERILASADAADDDRFAPEWRDVARRAGFRALLAIPISGVREDAKGLVLIFFASARTFADDDLEVARHLANASRGALERSDLFEAERSARALSQQLARTGGVLATELDPTAVLDEVVRHAPSLVSADACALRLAEDDELVVSAASGDGVDEALGARAPSSAWLSGDVFQSSAPVAVENVAGDERLAESDPFVRAGYNSFLGVPLTGPEGSIQGVLAVYGRRPRTWRPEEIEALLALAANTSAALSNAELYSRVSLERERLVAILANIADGIVAVDRDGKVVLWNAAAAEITGVPAEEAVGRTPVQVLQRTLEPREGEAGSGARLVSIARGGEEAWLSLSEAVMRDPLGAVAGRIYAFRDISADRMVEEVKSDFVAAVSHELRSPLTSIYGFAETLLRQDVPFGEDERRTFIAYIASESRRLTQIVDQLLNVARLDAGDLHVRPEAIDVAAVASEVVESAGESGGVDGHRFALELPAEPLAAEADRDKLRQVFGILVDNALKYSPGGGTVTVAARRKDDAVEVRVRDEGIGIPLAERERIFRKFYRAESAARAGGTVGTGLGLFIARELVTAMGGRIWVEATDGKGSSFAFELPVARESADRRVGAGRL